LSGFFQGFFATAIGVGIPATGAIVARAGVAGLGTALLIIAVMSVLAGLAFAIWRLIQTWAYNQVSDS